MKKYATYLFLALIIAIGIATRFYKLGEAPAGLYVDEAGQGYSAYSILKTGKDEFEKSFPIVFRSLTDFKTPVYIYLVTPLIPFFGLSAFTVRFPSFLFSILTIPVLFFITQHLSKNVSLAIIGSLLLAISPWHILFGRTNFECNVALFFYLLGVLSFYLGLKNPKLFILSAVSFAIAIPSYHSQRIVTPLTLMVLFIRYKDLIFDKTRKKYIFAGIILGALILLPTLSVATTPGFLARAAGLNIFSHIRQMPDGFIASYHGILNPVINGSWFLSTREFLSLYFSYFSPRYMFFLGDYGARSSFPELSTFFLLQFPFYIYGLFLLFKKKNLGNLKFFIVLMLLISPIPAAVTRDPYTTIRALPLVVPQILIVSLGIFEFINSLKNRTGYLLIAPASVLIISYSLAKLYSSVIILNEYHRAKAWDFGWQEVVQKIQTLDQKLPIVVDNARADAYPQIAFYLKYDPGKFQSENFEVKPEEYYTNLNRVKDKHIGNITTRPIFWKEDLTKEQYLIGDELAISIQQIEVNHLTLISEVLYPDRSVAYRIVKTNPLSGSAK